ncbi:MAG: hypothetical protein U0Q12_27240 [Vicinamibacterales bacterium]
MLVRTSRRAFAPALASACLVIGLSPLLASAQTTRVSVATGGVQAGAASGQPAISGDGRFVVFTSDATNLTSDGKAGTFLHDRQSAQTSWLSEGKRRPGISQDGRYVLYAVPQTAPEPEAWVVLDRTTTTTRTVPPIGGGSGVANHVVAPVLSADGRHVAYYSDRVVPSGTVFGRVYRGIFVHDLGTGTTCSAHVATDGTAGNVFYQVESTLPPPLGTSADGRYVTFVSASSNLVTGDTNGVGDIFVHDCTSATTVRASVSSGGAEANGVSGVPSMSADGRYVVFGSAATNLTLEGLRGFFVFDRASSQLVRLPIAAGAAGFADEDRTAMSEDGRYIAVAMDETASLFHVFHYDRSLGVLVQADVSSAGVPGGATSRQSIDLSRDGRLVTFASAAVNLVATDTNAVDDVFVRDVLDPDGDGMTTEWETFFGFNPADAADGATDADGDGRTNAQEFADGTHPRGLTSATRFFAEGAASAFFATRLAVANPSSVNTARVVLRYLRSDGTFRTSLVAVPPLQARKILVNGVASMDGREFSTVIESDQPIVADRLMWWTASEAYGSSAERGIPAAANTWYLAEGSTTSGFSLFYLFQNPGDTTAQVEVQYLLPSGAPIVRTYAVPARSRFNVWVNTVPELANTDVSAVVRVLSGPNIIVERAMYLSSPTQQFAAGHESAGVTAPSLDWAFAEGATGQFFDLFLLIANPNPQAATVEVTYLLPDGSTLVKTYPVAANSRFNVWVDEESFAGVKALANAAVSMFVHSTTNVPIVAERAMWWPGSSDTWIEAHNSAGATATAPKWAVADGEVGLAPANTDTYLLVANRSAFAAQVRATLLFTDGSVPIVKTFTVLPTSRFNIDVRREFPSAIGKSFGAIIESIDSTPAALVVERALYSDAGGVHWAAGANALATPIP